MTDYVEEKRDVARQAFFQWMSDGKPRCGCPYEQMYKTRIAFKHFLRHCQRNLIQFVFSSRLEAHATQTKRLYTHTIIKYNTIGSNQAQFKADACANSLKVAGEWLSIKVTARTTVDAR